MTNRKVYLDNACTSIVQPAVLAAADRYTDLYRNSTKSASDVTRECRTYLETAREASAKLIGCGAHEIALIEGTSHGLGIIAGLLPLTKDDNILVADLEYQASVLCFVPRQKAIGFEIREVKTQNGELSLADFRKYFDDHTRAIVVAAVQEINGWRTDIREIADFLAGKNCYLIVDGVQEAGAMQVNVKETGADFYCAGGKKWIGNPFGKGFLYVKEELIPGFEPAFYSYFKIEMRGGYRDYITYLEDPARDPFDEYELIQKASKFENGGYDNYLGALGLTEAIELQLAIGTEKIETRIKELAKRYMDGLDRLGLRTNSSRDDAHRSGIVAFNFGFRNGSIERERRLIPFLQERNIYVSLRSSTGVGGIRTSIHYYNTEEDIDALLAGIRDFLEQEK